MIIEKQVKVAKEVDDVMILIVKLVQEIKASKDIAKIAANCLPDLLVAIDGISDVTQEWAEDKGAVISTVLSGASGIANVLLGTEVQPD